MPRISGRTLAEHRDRVRRRVFDALGELLSEHDYEDLTFAQIAQAAGVGRTAMYNHFPDRSVLLAEYALQETTDYLERLRAGIAGADDPTQELRLYVRTQVELNDAFHMPGGGAIRTPLPAETAVRMREHVLLIEDVLRQILHRGIEAGEFRTDLAVDPTIRIIHALLIGRPTASREDPPALEEFIVRGVLAATPVD
ncbi:TetR/AcrR family transcriptional regulator [Brachybacterium sp. EF45031]|uniref:TetR/AcrR family transcriptional regulator n=1 Tax=Brachybacterium sillae TaxID=2810536 RepID=UPI00217DA83C|nr:TetR/AcrR family transcriptional regulator [Brachybacterium sillae]MCS6712202.1 TetR/AcrR family transcriptional regulator [Brachybacterium sillae]